MKGLTSLPGRGCGSCAQEELSQADVATEGTEPHVCVEITCVRTAVLCPGQPANTLSFLALDIASLISFLGPSCVREEQENGKGTSAAKIFDPAFTRLLQYQVPSSVPVQVPKSHAYVTTMQ